jgi:CRP-like cAMP-binding protein
VAAGGRACQSYPQSRRVCAAAAKNFSQPLRRLTDLGSTEHAEAGRVLFQEADRADKVYLILDGRVRIYGRDGNRNEIELATFGRGEFFGEMALFDRGVRSASVKALEPCELFTFDGEKFLAMVLG